MKVIGCEDVFPAICLSFSCVITMQFVTEDKNEIRSNLNVGRNR